MYVNPYVRDLYRTAWEEPRGGYLRLDMNECPEGLPGDFLGAVMAGVDAGLLAMYPEQHGLLDALEAHLGVPRPSVCLTNGSDDAIRLAFTVFARPGSAVLTLTPTFEMYPVYCGMYGLKHRTVPVGEDFSLDAGALLDALDGDVSIVALLNPNSPAGRPWTRAEAEAVAQKARGAGALLIIDEAYHYFHAETFMDMIGAYENVMVLRSFSKACALAGCRAGYAAACPQTADLMRRASSTYAVNAVALHAARALLNAPEVMRAMLEREAEGRRWLIEGLEARGYPCVHNGGNYVLIRPNSAPEEVFARVKARGILIKTYRSGLLRPYIRVTTGGRASMERFMEAFIMAEEAV